MMSPEADQQDFPNSSISPPATNQSTSGRSVTIDENVEVIKPTAEELLRKIQELEAQLAMANNAKANNDLMASESVSLPYIGSPPGSASRNVTFDEATINPLITPRKRKSMNAHSPANAWDAFTTITRKREVGFDGSSAFDLKAAYIRAKKELYQTENRHVRLAHLTKCKEMTQHSYYVGCLHPTAQAHIHSGLKLQGYSVGKSISGSSVIVYHDNLVQMPRYMQRKMMIGAYGGVAFVPVSELHEKMREFIDEPSEDYSEEKQAPSEEALTEVGTYIRISQFVRKMYGAGMAKPLDGRFMCICVSNAKTAHDIEDAVLLLGGCAIRSELKDEVFAGVSHIIYEDKDVEKNKKLRRYHKIHYLQFFEDMYKEFQRLKVEVENFHF